MWPAHEYVYALWVWLMNVSMEFKMSANISEPSPRRDHFSAPVEDKLYVWGGTGGLEKSVVTSIVHHYDPDSETWNNNTCEGPHPPGIREGACASTDHHLYTYGGFNEQMDVQGTLHLLDTRSRRWKLISSEGGPMKKTGCRMVIYDSKIVLFGGYGEPSGPIQPGAQFDKVTGTGSSGWTNELHTFNLKEGERLHIAMYPLMQLSCVASVVTSNSDLEGYCVFYTGTADPMCHTRKYLV